MQHPWQPTANLAQIKERARLLDLIRSFFKNLNVLEVDTPLLCHYAATAPYIDPIKVAVTQDLSHFLQTSPEYAMKRLLAFGCGDIFQVCKAFRGMDNGRLHNPEFTILEWYKTNFDHHQLMQETVDLLRHCGIAYKLCKISYREIFNKYLNIDPVLADLKDLQQIISNMQLSEQAKNFIMHATKQDCQELLFSHEVEPKLEPNTIWLIYNYPAEQAALAKINFDQDGCKIAERFEVYVNGMELANGYHELLDPNMQQQRFLAEQATRTKLLKPALAIDPYLIAALEQGLPNCSGIALGVDRLLMLITNTKLIKDVICFPWETA